MSEENQLRKEILDVLLIHPKVAAIWQDDRGRIRTRKSGAGKYRRAGIPDIIGFTHSGLAILMEVKTKKGVVSDEQIEFFEIAKKTPAISGVVRSIEDALLLLQNL